MDDQKKKNIETEKKGFMDNEFVLFFFGPFIFLIIIMLTGYQIFYNGNPNNKEKMKSVWLLSLGTLFYAILIVTLILTVD